MRFNVKGATLPPAYRPHDGAFRHLHGTRVVVNGKPGTVLSAYAGDDGKLWGYVQLDVQGGVQNGRFAL